MISKGQPISFAERLDIGERWAAGQTDAEIAAALGRSVWVVRKWRRRYQQAGRAGLVSRRGRPATGALGSFPEGVRQAVERMREEHPGWGPLTLLTELKRDDTWAGQRLPSRSRIAAYLKEQGQTRKYERHSELPQEEKRTPQRPHEEWEMDAQGVIQVSGLGPVSIINIGDVYSRLKVESLPCVGTSHPDTQDYQLILRRAFATVGLPERISLDHDSVFYDNTCPSPFPSLLHLWLIALGIAVRFIEKPPPQEHSRIERDHQTITWQAIIGQHFSGEADLQEVLTDRLAFLNHHYPSRSLEGKPPLVVFPEAHRSPRPYRLEWEAEMLDMQRVYDYLAAGRWFRKTSRHGQFSLGAQQYNAGKSFANQTLEIVFDAQHREFVCKAEDGTRQVRLPAQGLCRETLMGELSPLVAFPAYQLALPFSRSSWRETLLCSQLAGTTL